MSCRGRMKRPLRQKIYLVLNGLAVLLVLLSLSMYTSFASPRHPFYDHDHTGMALLVTPFLVSPALVAVGIGQLVLARFITVSRTALVSPFVGAVCLALPAFPLTNWYLRERLILGTGVGVAMLIVTIRVRSRHVLDAGERRPPRADGADPRASDGPPVWAPWKTGWLHSTRKWAVNGFSTAVVPLAVVLGAVVGGVMGRALGPTWRSGWFLAAFCGSVTGAVTAGCAASSTKPLVRAAVAVALCAGACFAFLETRAGGPPRWITLLIAGAAAAGGIGAGVVGCALGACRPGRHTGGVRETAGEEGTTPSQQ